MNMYKVAIAALLSAVAMTAHSAADPNKVLRTSMNAPETGLDPARISDVPSITLIENMFEPLLSYDYVARPAKLVPNTLTAMPEVSSDGRTFTFHLLHGVYFAPDPVFKGQKRELTAADYVYSFKRLVDPATSSPNNYLVSGKFVGLDELVEKSKKAGKFDYDSTVEGLKALDRYTLQIKLKGEDPSLLFVLTMPQTGAVAREVIQAYGTDIMAHPVGTGPYMLQEWKQGLKTTLVANPNFHHVVYDFHPEAGDEEGERVAREMNGKTMPQIGKIEYNIYTEEQPMWLSFKSQQLDELYGVPQPLIRGVLVSDPHNPRRVALKPEYRKLGIKLTRNLQTEVTYHTFNMKDPVLGGLSKDKIALRRAIAMSFDEDQIIRDIRRNQAVRVQYLIPEGVVGHNPNFRIAYPFNRPLANALLDQFGYKIGADGYRTLPNGQAFSVDFMTDQGAIGRQWNEYWQEAFDSIKIRVKFRVTPFNDAIKALRSCQYGMYGYAWLADYPDGEDFVMLNYSKNIGGENAACYASPRYDALYEKARYLKDGPERSQLYDQMNKVMAEDTPWIPDNTRFHNRLMQPWVLGDMIHPIFNSSWKFMDIAPHAGQ